MAAPEPGPRAARGLRAFLACFNPAAAAGGGCCSMPQADDRKPDGLDAADARNGGVRAKSSVGGRGFRRPLAPILTSRPAAAAAGGTGGITARHYQHQPEAADDLHSAAADAVELSSDESDPVAQGWGLPDPVVDLAPSAAAAAAAVARMPDSASGRTSGGRSAPLWAALACAAAESPAAAGDFDESADAYFDARSNFSLALSNGGSSAAVSRRSTLQQQAPSFGEISIPPQQHVAIGTAANMLISSADAFAVREGGGSKTVQLSRVSSTSSAAGGGGKVSRKVTCSSGSAATLAPAAAADAAAAPPQLDLPPIIMPAAAAAVGPPPLVVSSVRDAVAKQLSQQSAASAAPPPDLAFAPPGLTFIRVPKVTGLGGTWAKVAEESSPLPMPIDVMLKNGWFVRKAHEAVHSVTVGDTADVFKITANLTMGGLPVTYGEEFRKDGSKHTWYTRRDLKPGRTTSRMFAAHEAATGATIIILRVEAFTLTGKDPIHIGEEYVRLVGEDKSQFMQHCLNVATGERATQFFVGRRISKE